MAKSQQRCRALDLDPFEVVNDSYGHGIGDQLLMRIARILEDKVRPGDTVARLGGDEFAVVVTGLRTPGETGLPARDLCLEVTESLLLDHVEAALEKLAQLQRLGVKLHVDDFGTGYSSLSYLQKFSYDSLKIDRSFVRALDGSEDSSAIVKTIIALGRMMRIDVIAEGVESLEQLASLREMKCPQVQGFYFSKPLAQESVPDLLSLGSKSGRDGSDPNGSDPRLQS